MSRPRMEVALTWAFSGGLALSVALLLPGLLLAQEPLLRWGIAALVATPAVATTILAAGLLARRDWLFAAVCVWILFVLLSSLMLAQRS